MTLVKFSPMQSLWQRDNRLDRVFDSFLKDFGFSSEGTATAWLPRVDVTEKDDALVLHADLPGMNRDDITLSVEDHQLTIRGERKVSEEDQNASYHRVERRAGAFSRTFTLPTTVRTDRIEASYRDGVLTVSIPKAEEVKPREIKIAN